PRDPVRHRAHRDEGDAGLAGEDARERRLPAPGRPPEDHARGPSRLEHGAERATRPEQVLLAPELVKAPRAHAGGERRAGGDGPVAAFPGGALAAPPAEQVRLTHGRPRPPPRGRAPAPGAPPAGSARDPRAPRRGAPRGSGRNAGPAGGRAPRGRGRRSRDRGPREGGAPRARPGPHARRARPPPDPHRGRAAPERARPPARSAPRQRG